MEEPIPLKEVAIKQFITAIAIFVAIVRKDYPLFSSSRSHWECVIWPGTRPSSVV